MYAAVDPVVAGPALAKETYVTAGSAVVARAPAALLVT